MSSSGLVGEGEGCGKHHGEEQSIYPLPGACRSNGTGAETGQAICRTTSKTRYTKLDGLEVQMPMITLLWLGKPGFSYFPSLASFVQFFVGGVQSHLSHHLK